MTDSSKKEIENKKTVCSYHMQSHSDRQLKIRNISAIAEEVVMVTTIIQVLAKQGID